MTRKYNFYAGPATLPEPVLEQIQKEMVDYHGMGLSLVETSHRSKEYEEVHNRAISNIRSLLGLGDNFEVLLLGGGATLQFAMVPMNLLGEGRSCDFVNSGSWAGKAAADAKRFGTVRTVYDGSTDRFTSLPNPDTISVPEDSSYLHITSNETIGGVQWKSFPDTGKVPIVCDMSSDILSRPIPADKFGLIYAGAQKNLGPAGVTVVIIRKDVLGSANDNLPAYLSYKVHADKNSLYNTPPVFSIYAMNLVLEWVAAAGGAAEMERRSSEKAGIIYDTIDNSKDFYRCPVDATYRSPMNVVFRLKTEELEKEFVAEATEAGMIGLKGHRSVGGCRASLYNAMPVSGARALSDFMKEFASKKG